MTTERVDPQPLEIDIELRTNTQLAGLNDDVSKSINYSDVFTTVRECVSQEFYTIEAVAECVATKVLCSFKPVSVFVRVKKPGALARKGVKFAAVEIERKA